MRQVAVITGSSRGIGYATACFFKEKGWFVAGIDKIPPSKNDSVDLFIEADVASPDAMKRAFDAISGEESRKVDLLVNNAALQICKPLVDTEPEEWDMVMAANLRSVYLCIKYAVPLMKDAGGAVVNIASVHAVATSAGIAAYAASKGGVLSLTRALAIELAPYDIRVNAILPGAVYTEMLLEGLQRAAGTNDSTDVLLKDLASRTVLGRIGNPREIAASVWFLADRNMSGFMTGQSLVVDGGATARLSTE
jgi:NAD(P)-dependent dehydrogenase (short-subunit alcohol dehydrogenase family)